MLRWIELWSCCGPKYWLAVKQGRLSFGNFGESQKEAEVNGNPSEDAVELLISHALVGIAAPNPTD